MSQMHTSVKEEENALHTEQSAKGGFLFVGPSSRMTLSCPQNWAAQTAVGSTPKHTSAPQGGEGVERSSEGWEGGPLTEPPRTPPLSCVPRAEAPPAGASAAASVEVDAASQASEPASQASDEEDAPSTDIYFVSPRSLPTPVAPEVPVDSHTCLCPGSSLGVTGAGPLLGHGETRAKAEAQESGWSFWGQVLFMMVGPGDLALRGQGWFSPGLGDLGPSVTLVHHGEKP